MINWAITRFKKSFLQIVMLCVFTDATQAAIEDLSMQLYEKPFNELSALEIDQLLQRMTSPEETLNIEGAFV